MKQKLIMRTISQTFFALTMIVSQGVWAVQPYNMTKGATKISEDVFGLHMAIFYICCVIGVLVFGAMAISLFRDRKSKGVTPAKFHESTALEFVWTALPFVILIGIAIPAAAVLIKMEDTSNADMTVKVTGYQWMWRYEYIDSGIDFYSMLKTSRDEIYNRAEKNEHYLLEVNNELVLPTNRKIRILITSNDVIHAWWVPALALKKDAIPGYINQVWTEIEEPGVYRGQCAELCGRDHGFMPIVVRALSPEDYDKWVAEHTSNKNIASMANKQAALEN
jgi:cytochrome c oxidase subunit 2